MMETNIQIFTSDIFGEIRTCQVNNQIMFVGKDVAMALGYANTRKAVLDHVDKEDREDGVTIRDAIGRDQKATFINESGLYSLILSSKLPQAKAFKRWVTAEVLPQIRKTGGYIPTRDASGGHWNISDDLAARTGISYYRIDLKALDAAYSIAFPHSTPLNINRKARALTFGRRC